MHDAQQAEAAVAESATATGEGHASPEEHGEPQAHQGAEQGAEAHAHSGPAPIAVVLRPCETRALVELVKLQQASMDPFLVIGVDCWGTYSVTDYAEKADQDPDNASVTGDFLKQVAAGQLPEGLRSACRVCRHPAPANVDISVQLIGEEFDKRIRVQSHTDKGKRAFDALGLEETPENDKREAALTELTEAKKRASDEGDVDFLELIASLCINCHNCRSVCPICYCKQCVFEGKVFEYTMDKYLNWSGKRGVLGVPPDKLLFHLTRMSHVAASCVACGQCEAACPSGIPLGRIYQKVSAAVQGALDYEAGRSLDDELPLTTFREDELSIIES